jgi:hypothetical protein
MGMAVNLRIAGLETEHSFHAHAVAEKVLP